MGRAKKVLIACRSLPRMSITSLSLWLSPRAWNREQPRNSVLPYVGHFTQVMCLCGARTVQSEHGAYDYDGAPQQPIKPMYTPEWLNRLAHQFPQHATSKRMRLDTQVSGRVTGKRAELSESEHYCWGVCMAVADFLAAQLAGHLDTR